MPLPRARLASYLLWYGLGALFLVVALTPVVDLLPTFVLQSPRSLDLARLLLLALSPAAVWLALRTAPVPKTERDVMWAIVLASAGVCEVVHYWVVDKGHYFPQAMFPDNTVWQLWMHGGILRLDPAFLPHSYRFLPDCIVEMFRWLCGDFEWSRITYRLLGNSLFFAAVYRYARLYLTGPSSAAVVLLIVMVYPITILRYAGQFVDPASHLSFAVCLYCLAAGYEPGFGPSLLLGIFAKESVVVMALCRAFYGESRLRSAALAAVYTVVGVGVVLGIRLVVNNGSFSYGKVSGVEWPHVWTNLGLYGQWAPMYLFSLGLFLPGAALGWRYMDRPFKASAVLITVAMIVSSLIFSWLGEVRNLVPAFFPLAIVSLRYVEVRILPTSR